MKVSFRNLLTKKQFIFVAAFFLILLSIFYYTFFTANYYDKESPVKFEINRGESLSSVAQRLASEEIIPAQNNFKIAAFLYGAEKQIRAGRFYIPNGLSYLELVEFFISGKADFLREVKIYDGKTIYWVASKLQLDLFMDSTEVINLLTDKAFIDSLGINAATLEGYLFPQTYDIYERSTPREAVGIILNGFESFMTDTLRGQAEQLGYSIHEILTMASIVEGETNKVEEMPLIAGVYYNRLKIGMRLQADPTVQYLLEGGWRRLLFEDLKIDNPYNTYRYGGLPPGPINSPGKNAILSALFPEQHNYLFFVADGEGGHKFAENYSKHLKNVREYREWLKSQQKN
jgi:UPF0755 protein